MPRKIILPFLIALSLVLGACAAASPEPAAAPIVTSASPVVEPTIPPVFPLTISAGAGRTVTLDAVPTRIVSLSPTITEILFAVGAGSLVVGDTTYCDYPPEAQNVTKVGGFAADTISVETIVSLKPDLVLANGTDQDPVIDALNQANVKVIPVGAKSFAEVYANIEMVGKITGHSAQAAAIVGGMKSRVAAITDKIAGVPADKRPSVFWEVWDEPLMTAGPNTFIGQMIKMAGGVSIFADLTEDYPQVSTEIVIKRNPAIILGPDTHGDKLTTEQLSTRPGWGQIEAVKTGKIYLIDGNISSRSGPRLVDALEAIAKDLYPDLFQ